MKIESTNPYAFEEFLAKLLNAGIFCEHSDWESFKDCSGFLKSSLIICYPKSHVEVLSCVQWLNHYGFSFHAVSTGHNWGYGTNQPVLTNRVLINLSKMTGIRNLQKELSTIDIEPGVTQSSLAKYFNENALDFFVPTTGAGPSTSIIGNALERGFGLSPIEDHASAIVSLRAVLANGEEYQSYFRATKAQISNCYSWGVGPHFDSLFSQSNFGIVTEITLALQQRPESISYFLLPLADSNQLGRCANFFRELRQILPAQVGTLKVFNSTQVPQLELNFAKWLNRWMGVSAWNAFGVMYTTNNSAKSCQQDILKLAKRHQLKKIRFVSESNLRFFDFISRSIFLRFFPNVRQRIEGLAGIAQLTKGMPSEIGMGILYPYRFEKAYGPKNPAQDDKGLIWFSPLAPLDERSIARLSFVLQTTLAKFGFEKNPITFTVLNPRTIAAVVPIIFDIKTERIEAREIYKQLFLACKENGYFPYRIPTEFMDLALEKDCKSHWQPIQALKASLDPKNLYNVGRYLPDLEH